MRRRLLQGAAATVLAHPWLSARASAPLVVGFNAALTVPSWTAPRAIEAGLRIAIEDINGRQGGVLGGRPLRLEPLDHRGTTARARENAQALAAQPDVVAMFCDAFSPTALDLVPVVHELGLPMLNPWAAADGIVDHGLRPGFTFRLSLRDSWVMPVIVRRARQRGLGRLGLLALANSWGRSNEAALRAAIAGQPGAPTLVGTAWHNVSDDAAMMGRHADALGAAGAEALVVVGSVDDTANLLRALAARPAEQRPPLLSHWGPTAGDFFALCREQLAAVDLELVQTFDEARARLPRAAAVLGRAAQLMGAGSAAALPSATGTAQAYDLMQLLAMAIGRAQKADRKAVRQALTQLPAHEGLVRRLARPFAPDRHEALGPEAVFMARYGEQGQMRRVG